MLRGLLCAVELHDLVHTSRQAFSRDLQRGGDSGAKRVGRQLRRRQHVEQAEPSERFGADELFGARHDARHADDRRGVMERLDEKGNIIGFSILGVSQFTKEQPLEAELTAA